MNKNTALVIYRPEMVNPMLALRGMFLATRKNLIRAIAFRRQPVIHAR
ncbi:MAG: hypothetical protein KGL39_52110 [Patescibacteria group bacterium]|nr:hypothetical protein [Patescibacteria group bacterium]